MDPPPPRMRWVLRSHRPSRASARVDARERASDPVGPSSRTRENAVDSVGRRDGARASNRNRNRVDSIRFDSVGADATMVMTTRRAREGRETDALLPSSTTTSSRDEGRGGRARRALAWLVGACLVGALVDEVTRPPYAWIARFNRYVLGRPGRQITFRVYGCGVPQNVYDAFVPWPICRVRLAGCPGRGASCGHWRYADSLEMTPMNAAKNIFEVTTSIYGTGDVFGFALVEAGCNVPDETACERGSDKDCKTKEYCDHRYDSGTRHAERAAHPQSNTTCWEGGNGERCSSSSPFWHPVRHRHGRHRRHCYQRFGKWWNRVVEPRKSVIEYVWGTCMRQPEDPAACGNADLPTACALLNETREDGTRIEQPNNCVKSDNSPAPDGTVCRITHKKPGIKSMSIEGNCCNGVCCNAGEMCDRNTDSCQPIGPTITSGNGICTDPWYPQIYGVCTQSCGSGNTDCDLTCQAAASKGLNLTCTPGDPNNRCICSNVGGHTANECQNEANPGYKCCTCKSIQKSTNNGWGPNNNPGQNNGQNNGRNNRR